MKVYTNVSRKRLEEDRVAICPNFGCEYMVRVKPLKFRFFGLGKYPKCKIHHIPLVFVDERIGNIVDAALACLFDKSGLPPYDLLEYIKLHFPEEVDSVIDGWLYCITVGRRAPIISSYMDSISNTYLKQLTRKQIKLLKKKTYSNPNLAYKAIQNGMDEISIQYTRILKHLRVHSEIISKPENLKSLSKMLQHFLNDWQNRVINNNQIIKRLDSEMTLKEIKCKYDQILNVGVCRCLLGLNPESSVIKKAKLTAFDRFSAYGDFFSEGITEKFTKSDINGLYTKVEINPIKEITKTKENFETNRGKDNRSNSKKIGDYAEIKLIESLLNAGKNVLIPFGDNQRFDILFEENSKIYPVQVKTANKKGYFPIRSRNKEYDNVTHFGIYSREEKSSYLIPVKNLYNTNSTMVKLRNNLKEDFKVKKLQSKMFEISSIERCVKLMKEGKCLLSQLESGINSLIFYDGLEDMFQIIHTNDKSDINNNLNPHLYPINIAADLMTAGFILSRPIIFNSNYDIVIKKEYNTNNEIISEGFQKVKIIENFDIIKKYNRNVDFFAIYDYENDKTYLIPNNDIILKKYDKFLINRYNNVFKEMSANDLGDAMELRIGAEFEKQNYQVFFPLIGRQIYDLIFESENQYYKVQVKTGRKYREKSSIYFRFDTSTILKSTSDKRNRKSYKGKVDFICSVDRETLKCYIIPINKLPRIGAKLKLDKRYDARFIHHGTNWAEEFEFSNAKKIIDDYKDEKISRLNIKRLYNKILNNPLSQKIQFEKSMILSILKGTENIREHIQFNSELQKYIKNFRDKNKGRIDYQGVLSVGFRDFLIEQPEIKFFIEKEMEGIEYYSTGEDKHEKFYNYIENFFAINKRSPTTLELYNTFLNFKSYELRSKMRLIQK